MGPRFVVDVNVGRLAKWLRVLGYDACFVRDMADNDIIRLALREGRVIVTRDRSFGERRPVTRGHLRVALVTSDQVWEQLQEVVLQLGLDGEDTFSRCIECNIPLEDVPKEAVRERTPPYVFQTQEEFMECPTCRKVYWKGTHWANMRRELARIRSEAP